MRSLRIIALTVLLALSISAQHAPVTDSSTAITVVALTLPDWQDVRTANFTYELRVYSSADWVDANGVPHGAGSPNATTPQGRTFTQRITGLSVDANAHTLTIPMFNLQSTRGAIRGTNTRLSFWIVAVSGQNVIPVIQVPGTTNGLQIPATLTSTSGCAPSGTCGSFADLIVYNTPSPPLPIPTYPTFDDMQRAIAANVASTTPAGATYVLAHANSTLTNAQALDALTAGLMKQTSGIIATAVAGIDYQVPLSFTLPLSLTGSVVSLTGTYVNSFNGRTGAVSQTSGDVTAALGFTPQSVANLNVTYAGLSAGKVANSQVAEVLALGDLTDATGASGTGSTVFKGTVTSPVIGDVPTWNGTNWVNQPAGTITSVGLSLPAIFSVSGSPITSGAGTLTGTLATQAANAIWAGPTTGGASAPTFRAMVVADLPTVDVAHGGSGLPSFTAYGVLAAGTTSTGNFQQVSGTGTSGQVLTSNGAGALPTWQAAVAGTTAFLNATDATNSAPVRGGIVTAQGSGTPTWTQLALGTSGLPLVSNGTDLVYGQASLTAGVSGILPIANGGTNATSANYSTNGSAYYDGTRLLTTATGGAGTLCLTATDGGAPAWGSCAGSAATAWSALTAPGSDLAINHDTKKTAFTYANVSGTGANDMFTLKDATGNSSASGHIFVVSSIGASTIKPVLFTVGGTSNGVEMNASGVFAPVGTGSITANVINGVSTTAGIVAQTGTPGTFAARTLAAGVGITLSNASGAAGNPTITADMSTFTANQVLWDGSQSSRTLTANLSGTDPVITFGSSSVDVTTGTLKQGGTAVVLQSYTLVGGTGINTIGDLSAGRTISVDQSFSPTWTGIHTWTPAARSSGSAAYFTINIPTDTGITASTESIGFKTVTATRTWATGALTTQREFVFAAPTYAFNGSSTLTTAATVAITGAPIAGSNATITKSAALWLQAGRLQADDTGVVFDGLTSNLTSILGMNTNTPARIGLSHGSSGSPVNSDSPTVSMMRFDGNTTASGTVAPYFFGTNLADSGVKPATYNLLAYISSDDTSATNRDAVALVGYAVANSGSTSRAVGLYTESTITNNATGQGADVEFKVVNSSGVDSPAPTSSLPAGYTIGVNLTGGGGKLNTIGVNFQGGGTSAFKTLIHVANDVIASGGYGYDTKFSTRGAPMRIGNVGAVSTNYIYGRNNADSADKKLLGITSGDLVSIDGDGLDTIFGAGIRIGTGSFVTNTAHLYVTATQGLVVSAKTGSSYDLLFAGSDGTKTLLRNATGTGSMEVATQGDVVLGGNNGALGTTATSGFINAPSMAGTPTGVPTAWTGYVPLVYDTTNHRLYVRDGGSWRFVQF